ncbi:MAG: 4Fe-4S binding protein [Anaerolineales bacterium]|nr:MAG: 4Fe-4S binding protein [Anaerolineales bacterium]
MSSRHHVPTPKRRWPGLPTPSTRAFLREARRTPGYSLRDWIHGYVYARWPYLYIAVATGEHPVAPILGRIGGWFARRLFPEVAAASGGITAVDTYHGKVVPLQAATQLVSVAEDVRLTDLEQIIPYALARDIVLRHPDHIVVLECPCRAARTKPCLPLDVCLIIGEPFATFVAEHHPRRSRWIASSEAIEILHAEDERGHSHHAFFKDAMFGRFYAICNCCSCCCGAMQAWQHGTPMLASSGYISHVEASQCTACGSCTEVCPFDALSMNDGVASVDTAVCMGCGVCVSHCEGGALSLVRDPSKGEPLEIQRLIADAANAAKP